MKVLSQLLLTIMMMTQLALCQLVLDIEPDTNWYRFREIEDERSLNFDNITLITQSQPFNTNQNMMNISYYSTWSASKGVRRFYVTMTLAVEQPDVGQEVMLYLGFQPMSDPLSNWDIVRCSVPYDGNVNLQYRNYEVSDHWSATQPYYGGLDTDLTRDKVQNWGINARGSNSTCPGNFEKCVFQCQVAREFQTEDEQDINFVENGLLMINGAYHVYD